MKTNDYPLWKIVTLFILIGIFWHLVSMTPMILSWNHSISERCFVWFVSFAVVVITSGLGGWACHNDIK